MKVYRRYLAREVSGAILLVLLAFLALFAFFDLLGEIKSVGEGGYQLHHAFAFVLLRAPGRAYELVPIAVLIGTLYALAQRGEIGREVVAEAIKELGVDPEKIQPQLA